AAKWGMAGLLLAYAGLGSYCVVSALGHGTGPGHPQRVTGSETAIAKASTNAEAPARRATAAAASAPAAASPGPVVTGKWYAAKAYAQSAARKGQPLAAVSATAVGPPGASGDHQRVASLVLDGNSATAWVTHWYKTAHFGNLKPGTGLVLDMGKAVTV